MPITVRSQQGLHRCSLVTATETIAATQTYKKAIEKISIRVLEGERKDCPDTSADLRFWRTHRLQRLRECPGQVTAVKHRG